MNKVLLIGCGMQAYGSALDVINFGNPKELILADAFPEMSAKLETFLLKHTKPIKLTKIKLDAGDIHGGPGWRHHHGAQTIRIIK